MLSDQHHRNNATKQLTSAIYNADNVWTGNPANWNRAVDYTYSADTLNRQSVNDNGAVTTYSPSAMNQYQSLAGTIYNYDNNFNLREAPNWGGGPYEKTVYYQLSASDGTPLHGGNLKFQEVTTKDPKNAFRIKTSDGEPAHELIRGGLFKDHIGWNVRPGKDIPTGAAILHQKFRSEYPNGQPGPAISTQLGHVTTLHPNRAVTNGVYPIDP